MTHSGSTAKTRIRFIDTARGIAIICIILGHLGSASINRVVYTFHIPLFFLVYAGSRRVCKWQRVFDYVRIQTPKSTAKRFS